MTLEKPGKKYTYAHIYGKDKELLDEFWRTNKIDFKNVAYDVAVEGFFDFDKSYSKNINANWNYLASFKIDMVGFTKDYTYIIELKHQSKPEGIGQLLVYKYLLNKISKSTTKFKLLFVTYQLKPVIKEVCEEYGIETLCLKDPNYNILMQNLAK